MEALLQMRCGLVSSHKQAINSLEVQHMTRINQLLQNKTILLMQLQSEFVDKLNNINDKIIQSIYVQSQQQQQHPQQQQTCKSSEVIPPSSTSTTDTISISADNNCNVIVLDMHENDHDRDNDHGLENERRYPHENKHECDPFLYMSSCSNIKMESQIRMDDELTSFDHSSSQFDHGRQYPHAAAAVANDNQEEREHQTDQGGNGNEYEETDDEYEDEDDDEDEDYDQTQKNPPPPPSIVKIKKERVSNSHFHSGPNSNVHHQTNCHPTHSHSHTHPYPHPQYAYHPHAHAHGFMSPAAMGHGPEVMPHIPSHLQLHAQSFPPLPNMALGPQFWSSSSSSSTAASAASIKEFQPGNAKFDCSLQKLRSMRQGNSVGNIPSLRGFMKQVHLGFPKANAVLKYYAEQELNMTLEQFKEKYMVLRQAKTIGAKTTNNQTGDTANLVPSSDADHDRAYECTYCHQRFEAQSNYQQHMEFHATAQPFECTLCKKRFAEENALDLHTQTLHSTTENTEF